MQNWLQKLSAFYLFILLFVCAGYSNSVRILDADSIQLATGNWLGKIIREDTHLIPFNFRLYKSGGKLKIQIINGSEHLVVDQVIKRGDSVLINMPFFDSHFALRISGKYSLEGLWIKNYGDHIVQIPFQANYQDSITDGFKMVRAPISDVSGRWAVVFRSGKDSTLAIGEFTQTGFRVKGTFLTSTGDYRYLNGFVDGDRLLLSTFDGGHAYAFESRIIDKSHMTGFFYAGATNVQTWVAERNENASLPDDYSLTQLKSKSADSLHFKFPDLNGQLVSLKDSFYRNKVVIVQILGSWCPNCMDETHFLGPWYRQNKSRGVEIVGLAYERTPSFADSKRLLQPFINRFHVEYPILATGVTVGDSLRTEKTLPEIREIIGFPTTIFIDKRGLVRKIHTGFNGPGTGAHYEAFQIEFNELVNKLLAE